MLSKGISGAVRVTARRAMCFVMVQGNDYDPACHKPVLEFLSPRMSLSVLEGQAPRPPVAKSFNDMQNKTQDS
jgi:hypothetical protein